MGRKQGRKLPAYTTFTDETTGMRPSPSHRIVWVMRRIPQVLAVLYYSLDDGGTQTAHAAVHVFVLVQRLLIPRDKEEAAMMKKASPDQLLPHIRTVYRWGDPKKTEYFAKLLPEGSNQLAILEYAVRNSRDLRTLSNLSKLSVSPLAPLGLSLVKGLAYLYEHKKAH
ncbi:hypothetical protein V8E53_007849 [Lactarius tabidus]